MGQRDDMECVKLAQRDKVARTAPDDKWNSLVVNRTVARLKRKQCSVALKRYIPEGGIPWHTDLICIAVRVAVTRMVFAYIVYAPLRCRYKHNVPVTCLCSSLVADCDHSGGDDSVPIVRT